MTDKAKLEYLGRAFERLRDGALVEVRMALQTVTRDAAKAGALQSGRTLLMIKTEYVRVVSETGHKMTRLAFDATGTNTNDIVEVIHKNIVALRDAVSNDLAEFFRTAGSWAGMSGQASGNDFLNETDKSIAAIIDDFRHGISEGKKLTKDPVVSVVSSITNSPGAVMQSGVGNIQTVLSAGNAAAIRQKLTEFVTSKEVQALPPEEKQGIADVAEVIDTELGKPTPDASKLTRWGKRLIELAEKLGIAVAASGVSHALFG